MIQLRRYRLPLAAVLLVGLLALAVRPLVSLRPQGRSLEATREVVVGRVGDGGPGSLREAIFFADRAGGRARILFATSRIVLRTPLPPLVNADGVTLDASETHCEIDASALDGDPVLDIAAPGTHVVGLRVRGATGTAFLVRAAGARLEDVAARDGNQGISIAGGGDGATVTASTLADNAVGVRVDGSAERVLLLDDTFRGHRQAAVWAAAAEPQPGRTLALGLAVRGCRFEQDEMGVFAANVHVQLERNEFIREKAAGIHVEGTGTLRGNRIRDGRGVGIRVHAATGVLVEGNEVDGQATVGILVQDADGSVIRANRLHRNGYGLAFVFGSGTQPNLATDNLLVGQLLDGLWVVGTSPVLRQNRVLGSGGAALRVLEYIPLDGPPLRATPLVTDNVFRENGQDEPVVGTYRVPVQAASLRGSQP